MCSIYIISLSTLLPVGVGVNVDNTVVLTIVSLKYSVPVELYSG